MDFSKIVGTRPSLKNWGTASPTIILIISPYVLSYIVIVIIIISSNIATLSLLSFTPTYKILRRIFLIINRKVRWLVN